MLNRRASLPSPTLAAVMAQGRTTGFDYLRLILATAVVCVHSIDVSYGLKLATAIETGPARPLVALIMPMFFALSGFLVAGSLDRCRTIVSFLGLRAIRLIPALAFETLLAALILGPLLTRLSLGDYFSDGLLPRYFLNILGHVQYQLPGLFEANPWAGTVNAQLWTLPYELMCYAILAALAVAGIHRRRGAFVLVVIALNALLAAQHVVDLSAKGWNVNPVAPGPAQVMAFLWGIVLHLYRDRIAHARPLGAAAGVLALAALVHPATDYLAPVLAAYFVVWLGLMRPPASVLTRHGDYSYGIFLFGFPIQQAVTQVMGPSFHQWYWNLAAALPLTVVWAMASWHLVEKPSLALRGPLKRLEERMLASSQATAMQPSRG